MEPVGRPRGQKILLPWEIQIIEALEITPDEYFNYFDLIQQAKKERNEAYDHIPEVVNGPVTPALVIAIVGLVFTAASILLMPKPKCPIHGGAANDKGDDVRGRTKYSPLREFDSIQSLATLSDVVPLIYCNKIDGQQRGVFALSHSCCGHS